MPGPLVPGAAPGIESNPEVHQAPAPGAVSIVCTDFSPDRLEEIDVHDLDAFLAESKPEWATVRWVSVRGLHPQVINCFRKAYGFHTLAAEDALKVPQRPRIEPYPDYLFIVAAAARMKEERFTTDQVSFFYYGQTILSFEEETEDLWPMVRQRLRTQGSTIRQGDGAFLLYSLLDSMIDQVFPVVEHFGDLLEILEDRIIDEPIPRLSRELHAARRKLLELRRVIWPMRLMIHDLQASEFPSLGASVRTYLRDVHEHAVQLIDVVETYRDLASGMIELYLSAVSFRMNEVMKVLTIIATIFIPMTFLAGVYGMNFRVMPELDWAWSYPTFWLICVATAALMVRFFRKKGWIGEDDDGA